MINIHKTSHKLALGCAALIASSSLAQAGSGFVVGVSAGAGTASFSNDAYNAQGVESDLFEEEKNSTAAGFGAKVGYDFYLAEQHGLRLYVDYAFHKLDSGIGDVGKINMHNYALNFDYRYDFMPIIGVFAGPSIHYTQVKNTTSFDYNVSQAGFGIGGGVVVSPLSFLEIELRVRYLNMNLPQRAISVSADDTNRGIANRRFEMDEPVLFSLGVNFKF